MKNRRKLSIFALICIVAACIGLASCSDSTSAIFDIPEGLWGDYEGVTTLKISRHEIIYNNMPIEDYLFLGGEGRITYLSQETLSDTSYSCIIEISGYGMTERFHITATLTGRTLTLSIPEYQQIPATFTKISE